MKKKIFFLCPGLGRIKRGYESFISECFSELSSLDEFEIYLYKSAGLIAKNTTNVPCLFRRSKITKFLGWIFKKHPYYIEQLTFAVSILPFIFFKKPDLIFLSDGALANAIWHYRNIFGFQYRILFSNGGPLPTALKRWDHVQQLAPVHFDVALKNGLPEEKQTVLPYALDIHKDFTEISQEDKISLRKRLNLPLERKIIISVGTINNHHKRMNYLINEISALPLPRPFLLILGQEDKDSEAIKEYASDTLGNENISIRTVPRQEVSSYYKCSDIFVLASLQEGLARVFLEASAAGLPCIAHDYEVPRYATCEKGYYVDMKKQDALKECILQLLDKGDLISDSKERHILTYLNFSWDVLKNKYIELFNKTLNQTRSDNA